MSTPESSSRADYDCLSGAAKTAVILCAHNGARYLREQLSSIRAQTVPVDELHVFDWGSRDETVQIVKEWDPGGQTVLIIHERTDAPGPAKSFLRAMAELAGSCDADLIFLCDQDDIWLPSKVATFVQCYLQSEFDLAFSDLAVVDADGNVIAPTFYSSRSPYSVPTSDTADAMLLTNPVVGMTMCVRAAWLRDISVALDSFWIMHDWALCILCHLCSGRIAFIDRQLVQYRQHGGNMLGAAQARPVFRKLVGLKGHVRNVRRQIRAVGDVVSLLDQEATKAAMLSKMSGRFGQAKVAMSPLLRFRYRIALAAAFLLF